jgi:hypothetical protein
MKKPRTTPTQRKSSPSQKASPSDDYKNLDEAQMAQDLELAKGLQIAPDAKALIAANANASSPEQQFTSFDPIENAMRCHPGLTRETAEKMAKDFGF